MLHSSLLAASILQNPMTLFLSGLALLFLFFWYFATDLERRKRNIGTFLLIGICGFSVLAILPEKALKGGIDLVGGSSFTLVVEPKVDDSGHPLPLSPDDVKQAIRTIEKRVNEYGNIDMLIAQQGADKILLQMPGMSPEESAKIEELLKKVAKLELREVNLDGYRPGPDGRTLAARVADNAEIVPGYSAYEYKFKDDEGNDRSEFILLSKRVALTGKDVQQAWPQPLGNKVSITLNNAGADKMLNLTKDMTLGRDRIAVVLDGEVLTAPVVQAVLSKNFEISGQENAEEARALANAMLNPLENPLKIDQKSAISPTAGKDTVRQGIWAGIVGLSITAAFVLLFYRLAGFVALFGLAVNGLILFGAMAVFGFTFTLAGIAGMILSIGMAVDANVLIYERLREEIAAGKSLKTAIPLAYEKAFSAIFDANLTSLITAVVLFWLGNNTLQGFAITLTIGIIASMFSAILVTRVLFRWSTDLSLLRKLSFLNLIGKTTIDFLAKAKPSFIVSGILIAATLVTAAVRGEKALGIDFTGGTLLSFNAGERQISAQDVQQRLDALSLSKLAIAQEERSPITGLNISIRCATEDRDTIVNHLREAIPVMGETLPPEEGSPADNVRYVVPLNEDTISATLGQEFFVNSLIALALGMLGILVYITVRFEFSFALGCFISLVHDVAITVGIILMLGGEMTIFHVGAILTVAGYSVNDTIVIFDRIRETLSTGERSVRELINEAINATLSRTILTSLTTIITVTILTIFGGAALRDFCAMILVGLLVGTYSSIFIASPIVLWWSQRKGGNLRNEVFQTTLQESGIQT